MSKGKLLTMGAAALFSAIAIAAYCKRGKEPQPLATPSDPVETPVVAVAKKGEEASRPLQITVVDTAEARMLPQTVPHAAKDDFPVIDRVFQLFATGQNRLPIVETITYTSSASWLKGRPAWIADYAMHFNTSRHFIARSLNGRPDYFSQKVLEGSKFNVFRQDKRVQFYLLVDVSRLKMGFYYVDLDSNERVLLKTYPISLGRLEPGKPSGTLTPLGRYGLGDKVAIYQQGTKSYVQGREEEMIRLFGTRWIPFGNEIERCTSPSKGLGIYGAPWVEGSKGKLVENRGCIGKYETDGGIRMTSEDLEELFSIIITKPTFIEIVTDFREAKLPGIEVATPTR